jgi:hypothetical protein
MTVYLYCEGVTDYAVIPLLMKKMGKKFDLDIQRIERETLKKMKLHRKNKISRPYKLINTLAFFAQREGCKYIAYHQDADRHSDERYNSIREVFKLIEQSGINCLAVVPKETIESWLLADEHAYPEIPKDLPKKPEECWGDSHDPRSEHPKCCFVRVLEQLRLENNRDTYAKIAEKGDIETLKDRCPVSFGRFCADMQIFIHAVDAL